MGTHIWVSIYVYITRDKFWTGSYLRKLRAYLRKLRAYLRKSRAYLRKLRAYLRKTQVEKTQVGIGRK